MHKRNRGFSLIELLITLSIMTVLAAAAVPRFANSTALYRAQATAKRIVADLSLAQSMAKISSAGQTVNFTTGSNSYALAGVTGLSGSSSPYVVNLAAEPYQSKFTSVVFGSGTTITFDRFGQPSSGGSIVVQSGNATATIIVDSTTGKGVVQ